MSDNDPLWAAHMKHQHVLDMERLKHVEEMWLSAPTSAEDASLFVVLYELEVDYSIYYDIYGPTAGGYKIEEEIAIRRTRERMHGRGKTRRFLGPPPSQGNP